MKLRRLLDLAAITASLLASACISGTALGGGSELQTYSASDESAAGDLTCGCDDCACDSCGCGLWYGEADALLWWRKSRPFPPLVTTSDIAGQGIIGQPSTMVLFGDSNNTGGVTPGGRATLGRWLDDSQCFAIAGDFYALGQDQVEYGRSAANINEILAIPFINISNLGTAPAALVINSPGTAENGRVNVRSQNDLLGADAYARYLVFAEGNLRVDAIGGYQFSRIDDGLTLNANYDSLVGLNVGNVDVTDNFSAQNEFHGGTLGLLLTSYHGPWSLVMMGKVGLGNMRQTVNIHGQTTTIVNGVSNTVGTGLFTQDTNIGTYSNDEFGVVPEARININYQLNANWSVGLGYSFIYWNDVVTAGNTLDRTVNLTTPLIGPERPAFAFGERTDFWAQGANLSLQFAY